MEDEPVEPGPGGEAYVEHALHCGEDAGAGAVWRAISRITVGSVVGSQ